MKHNCTFCGQNHCKQAENKEKQTKASFKVLSAWVLFFYSFGHFIFDIDGKGLDIKTRPKILNFSYFFIHVNCYLPQFAWITLSNANPSVTAAVVEAQNRDCMPATLWAPKLLQYEGDASTNKCHSLPADLSYGMKCLFPERKTRIKHVSSMWGGQAKCLD